MTSTASPRRTTPAWTAPVALAVAVLAVALAAWALLRTPAAPGTDNAPPVAAGQPAGTKAAVCTAFDTVRSAVSRQTNADPGPDPVAREAVAANARLATLGGGGYLLTRLGPGVPSELADAVRSFADDLQDIGMKQLAGVPNADPALTDQLNAAQAASNKITDLCK